MDIKITPTRAQFDAYEAIRKAQMLCEAENVLLRYFGMDISDDNLENSAFEQANGFTLADAINPRSPNYLLEKIVEAFDERMTYTNGEMSINACWEMAIEKYTVAPETEDVNELYKAECEITSCEDFFVKDSFVLVDRNYERLHETVGSVIAELKKGLPDGDYNISVNYSGKYSGYIDSDEGTAKVSNGYIKIDY